MSHFVIFDTDMTFGLPGAPVDSGLALLYLLGREDIDLKGITIVAGHESMDKTQDAVSWLLRLNGRTDIPVIKGTWRAAAFFVKTAAALSGNLSIITTGPLGNIYGASLLDTQFYSHVSQIIMCGGLLHPLQVPGWKQSSDITLSLDPLASVHVLNEAQRLVLMNMHIGTQVVITINDLFTVREYNIRLYHLIKDYLLSDACSAVTGRTAAYLWSMLPVLYLGNSDLFHAVNCKITADRKSFEKGIIHLSESGNQVNMPDYITDIDEIYKKMHQGWEMSPFQMWPQSSTSAAEGVGK